MLPGALADVWSLGLASYLPSQKGEPLLPELIQGQLVRLQNSLHQQALLLLKPVFAAEATPSFDDAVALLLLCSIATSNNDNHGYLPHWLALLKFVVKQLNLHMEPEGFDEESKEERRR